MADVLANHKAWHVLSAIHSDSGINYTDANRLGAAR